MCRLLDGSLIKVSDIRNSEGTFAIGHISHVVFPNWLRISLRICLLVKIIIITNAKSSLH